MTFHRVGATALVLIALAAGPAAAKVSPEEAARLDKDLTPVGAERAGNKEGTIPAWTGGLTTPPPGFVRGKHLVNPFAGEKPLFTITGANAEQYRDKLTEGQLAMLKTYPTYKMNVYPSHRTCGNDPEIYAAVRKNAVEASLTTGGNGITGALVAMPFPIVQEGVELFWNHRFRARSFMAHRTYVQATVNRSRDYQPIKNTEDAIQHYSGAGLKTKGDVTSIEQLNNIWISYLRIVKTPARLAGNVLLVYDNIDDGISARQVWTYNPGTRRVLRAPQIAFDNPLTNADGLGTSDQFDGWNGSPQRYAFVLKGKRELYMTANNYEIQSEKYKYDDILKVGHGDQDLMRYELQRAWVAEATLREGFRHVYKKRITYSNEDSWLMGAIDAYDMRGQLWRVQEAAAFTEYDAKVCTSAVDFIYDLQSGRYVAVGMTNEEPPTNYAPDNINPDDFNPDTIRSLGVR
jgi:hypothetical protein